MARYRLRFVLQEVDLPHGVTVIGRSVDCHLTIEDPLVSRLHARLIVGDEGVHVEDLGSRNGVRVNGSVVRGPTVLRSGDRLRIGTQELIFTLVNDSGLTHARTTGQLRLCANCRQPYPREMVACPGCEATEQTDDETLTASGTSGSHRWTVQLFVEGLERALRLGRVADAEKLIRRASLQMDEVVSGGGNVDVDGLAALAVQAAATSLGGGDPTWAVWALGIYGRLKRIPPLTVVEGLVRVERKYPGSLNAAVNQWFVALAATEGPSSASDTTALEYLRQLADDEETTTSEWPGA